MAMYEKVAQRIEDEYARGVISKEEHDKMMDDLVDRLLESESEN